MAEPQSVDWASENEGAPPTRSDIEKQFSNVCLDQRVVQSMVDQLKGARSGGNGTLHKSTSERAVRRELKKGVDAILAASGDKRLEKSLEVVKGHFAATAMEELVDWLFVEARGLAEEVEGEEAEALGKIFGVTKAAGAGTAAAENN